MADVFPFGLSIITLVFIVLTLSIGFFVPKSYTARPQFEIVAYGILSLLWLVVNSFSTSRWQYIPFTCSEIPEEFPEERIWCKDVQALKAFVWIEWIALLLTTLMTLRYTLTQSTRGNTHIFDGPLSRYKSRIPLAEFDYSHGIGATAYSFQGYGSTDVSSAKLAPVSMSPVVMSQTTGSSVPGTNNVHARDVFGKERRDSEFLQYPDRFT